MPDDELKLFEQYLTASQQFDYFITGLTGALCAYIIQQLQPQKLSFSPYAVEIIALALLIGSLIIGLKRIETTIEVIKVNGTRLDRGELLNGLVSAVTEGGHGPIKLTYASETRIVDIESIAKQIPPLQTEVSALKKKEEELSKQAKKEYRWRNRLLYSGFILLAVSKIMEPYFIKS